MACCALSTINNPFDPFEEFDKWFLFDHLNGYYCSEQVARRALCDSRSMSPYEIEEETERVIDEIIKNDPSGFYVKVEIGKFIFIPPSEYDKPTETETKSFIELKKNDANQTKTGVNP